MTYRFTARLWRVPNGTWHFVTLPFDVSDEVDEHAPSSKRGFGSVRVEVRIGTTTWQTSVFPDSKHRSFVLPIKKDIRAAHHLTEGDDVELALTVLPE